LNALLKPADGNTADRLLKLDSDSDRARAAFETVYGRAPDHDELAAAADFLKERAEKPAAVRDLLWALMTSAEFLTMP
jgi:hypothetical protein